MFFIIILSCFLGGISAQYHGYIIADQFLKTINIEVDLNCAFEMIPDFYQVDTVLSTCSYNLQQYIISQSKAMPVENLIYKFCGENYVQCAAIFEEKLYPCLNNTQREILKKLAEAEVAVLSYICNENGQIIRELTDVDYSVCKLQKYHYHCTDKLRNDFEGITLYDYYSDDNCRKHVDFVECTAQSISFVCEDRIPYNFVRNTALKAMKVTPCEKFVSKSSQLLNLNILSLIMITLYTQLWKCLF